MKLQPLILRSSDDLGSRLPRVEVVPNDARNEAWLQKLLYSHPELLPVDEFGDHFVSPIAIGREVATERGPIDNVFVSPMGGITVVETKLWKNPEKHRTVVAQIIDYAKELATWDYDRFCEAILASSRRLGETDKVSLEKKVASSLNAKGIPLHDFQEGVAATLAEGTFLLLIVGDRIAPNIALLTKAIQSAPGLGFTLGLAEMQLFQIDPSSDWPLLVIPKILGRTVERVRGVIRVQYVQEKPTVQVENVEEESDRTEKLNEELFFKLIPKDLAAPIHRAMEQWDSIHGTTRFTDKVLFLEMELGGDRQKVVRFRTDRVNILRQDEIASWAQGSIAWENYLKALEPSPAVLQVARDDKMWVNFSSISPTDLETLLRAAVLVAQQIRKEG